MFLDAVFDPVLDIERVVSVSRVVWGDWHDYLLAAGVVPVQRVVDAVTDRPDRLGDDGRRVGTGSLGMTAVAIVKVVA